MNEPKALRVYFTTCDITTCERDYHVEYLDYELKCEFCDYMGAYYIDGEYQKIGLCNVCLSNSPTTRLIEIGDYLD
jgi:hypothetical protein